MYLDLCIPYVANTHTLEIYANGIHIRMHIKIRESSAKQWIIIWKRLLLDDITIFDWLFNHIFRGIY